MRHPSYKDYQWKYNILYSKGEKKFEIVEDNIYAGMFRVQWPDGVLSADCYNLTRARAHAEALVLEELHGPLDIYDKDMQERHPDAP